MNEIDLNQRHAVVNRGGQGLGLWVAMRLLLSGASVSLWDCDAEVLDTAQNYFHAPKGVGRNCRCVRCPQSV